MKANQKFSKDEEAVSPVIGVILMVAITVILAAVIAAFVFGMGSSLKKNYVIAATASQISATEIEVVYNGGPDNAVLIYLNASGTSAATTPIALVSSLPSTNLSLGTGSAGSVTVGGMIRMKTATTGRDHVIVTAQFVDGTTQVILDTYV